MSMMDTVRSQMMQAMKDHDKPRREALSMLLSALKAKFIDKRADLTEEEENTIVLKEIKQLQETIDSAPADRTDILDECRGRMAIYQEFAPQMMTGEEIRAALQSVLDQLGLTAPSAKDKGAVMKNLMPLVKGKADGAVVNRIVGETLK